MVMEMIIKFKLFLLYHINIGLNQIRVKPVKPEVKFS